ncbi:MAG: MarR family transcriptional regulator [Solirubrobacterales bacterium]
MVVKVTVKRVRAPAPAPGAGVADAGCGLLLTRLARAANRSLACSLAELGLRAQQFGVLHLLADSGPMSQADLADALRVHASNLVRVLDEIEEAGLIERERDPEDRRRQRVVLTAAGGVVLSRAESLAAEAERELLAPLSRAEQAQLRHLLGRITTHACGLQSRSCSA